MNIKDGAVLSGLDIRMRQALLIADEIYNDHGQDLTITCGLDGSHGAGSFHYYGLAIDLRTRFFTDSEKTIVYSELVRMLDSNYRVIFENTHFHIQIKI